MFYLLHEWKVYINAKVEQLTKMLGRGARLIVINPFLHYLILKALDYLREFNIRNERKTHMVYYIRF